MTGKKEFSFLSEQNTLAACFLIDEMGNPLNFQSSGVYYIIV